MLSVRSLDMGIPTVATFVVENNAKRSTIQESWYRYYNMKTHSALLAHCEINPPGSHISCFKAASVAHHSPWWLARSIIAMRHRIKSLLVDRRLGGFRRELKNIELYNQIISVMSCRVAPRHATPRHATSRHVRSGQFMLYIQTGALPPS